MAHRHGMLTAAGVAGGLLLVGSLVSTCSAPPPGTRAAPAATASAAPPSPPAACLLDIAKLSSATGVGWTPDATTASDARCVYDPAAAPGGTTFLTVTLADPTPPDTATALTNLGQLCDTGSRTLVVGTDGGFVCRFQADTVVGAAPRDGKLLTLTASAVPAGTTAAKLAQAVADQLAPAPR